jgi:tetratricopeptide (TPR) repeat protein
LRTASLASALLYAALLLFSVAHADGPAGYRPREQVSLGAPDLAAIDAYNEGYSLIQRAEHQENLALASNDAQERKDATQAAGEAYRASLGKFAVATQLDRSMHEAYTYIGYANRKLGQHQDALDAYARALRINPDYPQAIEYQGEAYLGLNQVDSARFNYLRLYALSPPLASKLFLAMQKWLVDHRENPRAPLSRRPRAEQTRVGSRAIDAQAGEIVRCAIGDRSSASSFSIKSRRSCSMTSAGSSPSTVTCTQNVSST